MILAIHKMMFFISILIGFISIFKRNTILGAIHKWTGFTAIISIFIYLVQTYFDAIGYAVYMLLLIAAACIPYIRKRLSVGLHIMAACAAIVWLVWIHIV